MTLKKHYKWIIMLEHVGARPMLEHSVTHTHYENVYKTILCLTGLLFHIDFFIFYHFYIELCYF